MLTTNSALDAKGQGKNNKHWYGYKRYVSVDMKSGLINKVAVTPANVPDDKAVKHILPKHGTYSAIKASAPRIQALKRKSKIFFIKINGSQK